MLSAGTDSKGRLNVFNILTIYQQLADFFNNLQGIGRLKAILAPIFARVTSGPSRVIERALRGVSTQLRGILGRVSIGDWSRHLESLYLFSTTYKRRDENKGLASRAIFQK